MSSTKTHRRGQEEKNRKGRLAEKESSFHGRTSPETTVRKLRRPRTVPDLLDGKVTAGVSPSEARPKLTKLLLNVTVQRSLEAVQVLMPPEDTVGDLIAAVLRQYSKEGRRPVFESLHPSAFGLHYSQFSLESLDTEEKLMTLGSRNFFLCCKASVPATADVAPTRSCSKEAEEGTTTGMPWVKFMDFLL